MDPGRGPAPVRHRPRVWQQLGAHHRRLRGVRAVQRGVPQSRAVQVAVPATYPIRGGRGRPQRGGCAQPQQRQRAAGHGARVTRRGQYREVPLRPRGAGAGEAAQASKAARRGARGVGSQQTGAGALVVGSARAARRRGPGGHRGSGVDGGCPRAAAAAGSGAGAGCDGRGRSRRRRRRGSAAATAADADATAAGSAHAGWHDAPGRDDAAGWSARHADAADAADEPAAAPAVHATAADADATATTDADAGSGAGSGAAAAAGGGGQGQGRQGQEGSRGRRLGRADDGADELPAHARSGDRDSDAADAGAAIAREEERQRHPGWHGARVVLVGYRRRAGREREAGVDAEGKQGKEEGLIGGHLAN